MKPCGKEKKQRLEASALRLFLEQGVNETSVNDIVKDAKLAKGTFYVYFKDKGELIHKMLTKMNLSLIETLISQAKDDVNAGIDSWPCAFVRRFIQYFNEKPHLLKLLHHSMLLDDRASLILPILEQKVTDFDPFIQSFQRSDETKEAAGIRFLLTMEICAAVCFNALFYHQPDSLENITEMFYAMMRGSFASDQGGIS